MLNAMQSLSQEEQDLFMKKYMKIFLVRLVTS